MEAKSFVVQPLVPDEIHQVARLLAAAYFDDIFFKWCVDKDEERLQVVAAYYEVYLNSKGCVAHVAKNPEGEIIGATCWLPQETEEGMHEKIEEIVGVYSPQFAAVAEKSYANEPKEGPFYQLVGFGVAKEAQGQGVGQALLKYHLDILDKAGIPTYLEASTPFTGGGVYGKFGYKPYGELMHFTKTAVLYPLYREANV